MAKKCPICKDEFKPFSSMEKVCSIKCAVKQVDLNKAKAKDKEEKAFKKETTRLKKTLKDNDKRYWVKSCQKAFNRFIRARDGKDCCISCGIKKTESGVLHGHKFDCGHYRSVGSMPALRFEELNAHSQCVKCNRNLSGNIVEYRAGLLKKIGLANVEWIEGPHKAKKYTIDELKEKTTYYNSKAKGLENEQNE